jgi:hypothetical protein
MNENLNKDSVNTLDSLSIENAQLHSLAERLSRVTKKLLNYPDLLNFYTKEVKDALADYDKFKEEVIWKGK